MAGTFDVPSPASLMQAGEHEMVSLAALLATTQPGESVHGARRRIKQLRSLLRLLRRPLGEDAYTDVNAALRGAADALAGHRRAEALVTAAAKLEAKQSAGGGFWRGLAETHRAAHATEGDPVQSVAAAQQAIARAATLMSATALSHAGEQAVTAAFRDAYRNARRRLRKGLASGDARKLHQARKYVIHHLHQLKLLEPGSKHRLAALEALRETLGDLNDLDELEQLADGAQTPERDARRMRKARARLLRCTEKAANRLFRHKPAAFVKRRSHAAAPRSPGMEVTLQGGE
jgi:CHAD domain-containing protein